jgi:hypothetical protein
VSVVVADEVETLPLNQFLVKSHVAGMMLTFIVTNKLQLESIEREVASTSKFTWRLTTEFFQFKADRPAP